MFFLSLVEIWFHVNNPWPNICQYLLVSRFEWFSLHLAPAPRSQSPPSTQAFFRTCPTPALVWTASVFLTWIGFDNDYWLSQIQLLLLVQACFSNRNLVHLCIFFCFFWVAFLGGGVCITQSSPPQTVKPWQFLKHYLFLTGFSLSRSIKQNSWYQGSIPLWYKHVCGCKMKAEKRGASDVCKKALFWGTT